MHKAVSAHTVSRYFGRVLADLNEGSEPIVIEKDKKPVALLIPFELFRKRFVDFQAFEIQQELLEKYRENASKSALDSLSLLRTLRYG